MSGASSLPPPPGAEPGGRRRDPERARVPPRTVGCAGRGSGAPRLRRPPPRPHPRPGAQRRRAQLSGKWPLRPVAPPTAAVRSPRDRTREAAAAGQAHARANAAAAARARARELGPGRAPPPPPPRPRLLRRGIPARVSVFISSSKYSAAGGAARADLSPRGGGSEADTPTPARPQGPPAALPGPRLGRGRAPGPLRRVSVGALGSGTCGVGGAGSERTPGTSVCSQKLVRGSRT